MPAFLKSKIFIALIVVLALGAGFGVGAVRWAFHQIEAPGPLAAAQVHVVPKGAGMSQIARELEAAGIIADSRLFRLYARYRKLDSSLHAGEYEFQSAASMEDVLAKLAAGKTVLRFVTIPEGLTSREAAALVAVAVGMKGIADVPAEGSILPETYTFTLDENRAALVGRMRDAMKETLAEARRTLETARQTFSEDAPLQRNARDSLDQVAKAAASVRVLTDYLQTHPEALIRGKAKDAQ